MGKKASYFVQIIKFAVLSHGNGYKLTGDSKMQTEGIKQEAYKILDQLPDKATWDDLMYQIYVRQTIEAGLKDSDEGRTIDVKEVRKKFGLTK